jgi:hypothetical protein
VLALGVVLGLGGCADDTADRLAKLERRIDRIDAALAARGISLDAPARKVEAARSPSPTTGLEPLERRLDGTRRAELRERLRGYEERLRERYPGEPGSQEQREAVMRDVIRRYRERRAADASPTPAADVDR